jgi:hypothetical protein
VTEIDIPALLRALAEQQTALLAAHAESMRVQRVLIERLPGTGAAADLAEHLPIDTSSTAKAPSGAHVTVETVAPTAATDVDDAVEAVSAETIATCSEPEAVVAEAAPAAHDVTGDRPALQVVGGTGQGRSDRYYRSAARPQPAPANVSLEQLNVLRAIHSVGDLGHLVLMFGPHAGETLGQVAQNDLEYLRQLATTEQRADFRAAAARLVAAVPCDPPVHRRAPSQRSRRGR